MRDSPASPPEQATDDQVIDDFFWEGAVEAEAKRRQHGELIEVRSHKNLESVWNLV